ncbi:L-seryl-tRNA(Sec) selenium transferase [Azospirillum sp. RWY-5-1]|uniref:L-seryl-tRNA(Sec) selenium transferase n=1 Tax=Azospirillum oleiclasticum TaxID=2735135 RepID=A0ABX2TAS8_9PROT|nr:L-seryl-tRNA(Sec) selenium transferase [Azospirillum oleiclasticum]NYZ15189.1 L-seryl-tRNA(Sec) selenium transferase [Azospirillum oleiclasticum]NYZ21390.1 L-seryl-tRNA(Sec) selenium transferase [Azospirillum oleiclasticum]
MSRRAGPLPSVDEVMRGEIGRVAVARFGHDAALGAVRGALDGLRVRLRTTGDDDPPPPDRATAAVLAAEAALARLEADDAPRLRRVHNLTGTVLHTNLGRAVLAEAAVEAAAAAMRHPAALEFDLDGGGRGERDDAVRGLLCELTGAEDACLVNNNAAAVLLVLNTLAQGRETVVSRGELIEIGGAFRMPEIMARAGTRLREVGTTNRTHLRDYEGAVGPDTGLLMKVHTSNYLVQGFTAEVSTQALAAIGRERGVPVVDDLGSGTLVDLSRYGLRRERTVQDAVADGADLVTFSGDKLLGGPQAGFIVGRRDLVRACAKNPIKRAVRLDKIRLAALEATLRLYRDPDRLPATLPTLRFLTRPVEELRGLAERLGPVIAGAVGAGWSVASADCASQIGSGALPLETIPSHGLAIEPAGRGASGGAVEALAAAFRRLPVPVIGRIEKGALRFDLRCLEDVDGFAGQLARLVVPAEAAVP